MDLQGQHTAMADIRESLNELKYYRRMLFKEGKSKKDFETDQSSRRQYPYNVQKRH